MSASRKESVTDEPVFEPATLPIEDRIDEVLTNAEIEEIRAQARREHDEDEIKVRKRAYLEYEREKLRREAGAVPPDEMFLDDMAQMVDIFIDLPRLRKATGGEIDPDPIMIDQKIFAPGRYYTVTKGQAIYIQSLIDANRRHVAQVDGRSRSYYNDRAGTMVHQGGTAVGGPTGPSFDSIHKRPA